MAACELCHLPETAIIASTRHALAFAATDPIKTGHVVVTTKRHVTSLADFTSEEVADFYALVRDLTAKIQALFPDTKVYQVYVGDMVKHFHMHLLPRHKDDPGLGPFIFDTSGWRGQVQEEISEEGVAGFVQKMRTHPGGQE